MNQVINNEYDYSNIIPTVDLVKSLAQYLSDLNDYLTKLTEEDEEKNKQFKIEYKEYSFKHHYSQGFEVFIREQGYNNITCKSYNEFLSAINDGNLKHISKLTINLDFDYERGKGNNIDVLENKFAIVFEPYNITFARKSNNNEAFINEIESKIKMALDNAAKMDTIFCTK